MRLKARASIKRGLCGISLGEQKQTRSIASFDPWIMFLLYEVAGWFEQGCLIKQSPGGAFHLVLSFRMRG